MTEVCIDEENLDHKNGKKDPDINKPDNLSHRKWVAWEETVYTYFTDTRNSRGVTLAYVIRKTPDPSGIIIDME